MNKINITANSINFIKNKGYHCPEGWVEACLQWLFEEHSDESNNSSLDKWCSLVEQQWLFTDLRDFETLTLLSSYVNIKSAEFSGIVFTQLMECVDISTPLYGQKRKNLGVSDDRVDEENQQQKESSRRTLKVRLSDGVNEISGLEYEPWLHVRLESLTSGCKCRLTGPFRIRNGIALLKPQNIEFIGGEVDDIKARTQTSIIEETLTKNLSKMSNRPALIAKRSNVTINPKVDSKRKPITNELVLVAPPPPTASSSSKTENSEIAAVINTQETVIDLLDEEFDEDFLNAVAEDIPDKKEEEEAPRSLIDIYQELSVLTDEASVLGRQYRVKAVVTRFLSKFSSTQSEDGRHRWSLRLRVSDETSSVDCQLHDLFVEKRLGFGATEFQRLRRTEEAVRLRAAVARFQAEMVAMSVGLWSLRLAEAGDCIEVVDYAPLGDQEAAALKERVAGMPN